MTSRKTKPVRRAPHRASKIVVVENCDGSINKRPDRRFQTIVNVPRRAGHALRFAVLP
jgi:hypothetical protein